MALVINNIKIKENKKGSLLIPSELPYTDLIRVIFLLSMIKIYFHKIISIRCIEQASIKFQL